MGGRGGGGDREFESEKIFWGGSHWQIRLGGGGEYWSRNKSQDLRSPEIGISEYGYYQLN